MWRGQEGGGGSSDSGQRPAAGSVTWRVSVLGGGVLCLCVCAAAAAATCSSSSSLDLRRLVSFLRSFSLTSIGVLMLFVSFSVHLSSYYMCVCVLHEALWLLVSVGAPSAAAPYKWRNL